MAAAGAGKYGRRVKLRVLLTVGLSLAVAESAAAHPGLPHGEAARLLAAAGGTKVTLRDCFLTAVFVPREASVLRPVFQRPLDLSQTFYGPDPLLGVWAMSCEGARVAGTRVGRVTTSLVGVPNDLTSPGAVPLANNFGHALIRIETTSPVLARALRRARLPGRTTPKARFRHSRRGSVPFRGRLLVPGKYGVAVSASDLDPTNPHDHVNRFEHRGADGRTGTLSLAITNAVDRFCFPDGGTCSATIRAPRRSAMARLLGGRSAPVRAGFDHERLPRIALVLRRGR